jgi:hypothetical protein
MSLPRSITLAGALALAACSPAPGDQVWSPKMQSGEERVTTVAEQPRGKGHGGGGICMICIGPHYNFGTGKIGIGPSIGPGISFF